MRWPVLLRFGLTAILMVTVWFHAHWSVALAITGLAIANEFAAKARQTKDYE